MLKDLMFKNIIYQKVQSNYYNVIINGKNVYDQAIDSHIKQYDKVRKLATGQGGDYTTRC